MPDLTNDGAMKGRQKGGDRSIDDAFKTMERFSQWLGNAREENVWAGLDPVQTAILYRFLEHIRADVEALMAVGSDDARNALELFRLMEQKDRDL